MPSAYTDVRVDRFGTLSSYIHLSVRKEVSKFELHQSTSWAPGFSYPRTQKKPHNLNSDSKSRQGDHMSQDLQD